MVRSADDDKEHSAEVGRCCVADWMLAEVPYSRLSQLESWSAAHSRTAAVSQPVDLGGVLVELVVDI